MRETQERVILDRGDVRLEGGGVAVAQEDDGVPVAKREAVPVGAPEGARSAGLFDLVRTDPDRPALG